MELYHTLVVGDNEVHIFPKNIYIYIYIYIITA